MLVNTKNDNNSPLDRKLGFVLARTHLTLKALFRRMLHAQGLDMTPEQSAVLRRLLDQEGLTQREVAAQTIKDVAAITRLVDTLERKALVARVQDPGDRRVYRLALTSEGRVVAERVRELQDGINNCLRACLAPEEERMMLDVLNRLYLRACDFLAKSPEELTGCPVQPLDVGMEPSECD